MIDAASVAIHGDQRSIMVEGRAVAATAEPTARRIFERKLAPDQIQLPFSDL